MSNDLDDSYDLNDSYRQPEWVSRVGQSTWVSLSGSVDDLDVQEWVSQRPRRLVRPRGLVNTGVDELTTSMTSTTLRMLS